MQKSFFAEMDFKAFKGRQLSCHHNEATVEMIIMIREIISNLRAPGRFLAIKGIPNGIIIGWDSHGVYLHIRPHLLNRLD